MTTHWSVAVLALVVGGCTVHDSTSSRPPEPSRSGPTTEAASSPKGAETRRGRRLVKSSHKNRGPARRRASASDAGPQCAGLPAWSSERAAAEREVVALINAHRAEGARCGGRRFGPVPALSAEPRLTCAARGHSREMARSGFFDHHDLQGRSPSDRIEATGYRAMATGENISAGQATARDVVAGWMSSPGHCANIMSPNFREVGVGHHPSSDAFGHYWTQKFGRR